MPAVYEVVQQKVLDFFWISIMVAGLTNLHLTKCLHRQLGHLIRQTSLMRKN